MKKIVGSTRGGFKKEKGLLPEPVGREKRNSDFVPLEGQVPTP